MANNLVIVEGYLQEHVVPLLENQWCVAKTLNTEVKSFNTIAGSLGGSALIELPTRTITDSSFGFNPDGDEGSFSQRAMTVVADKQIATKFPFKDIDTALFRADKSISSVAMSNINEIAGASESYYIDKVSNSGYRFLGDISVSPGQMQTVPEVTEATERFDSFGCAISTKKYFIMPMIASARTISNGLQQFVTKRNEELALAGEIGHLGGVKDTVFCKSNLLNTHFAGTAADNVNNLSVGYNIVSVTSSNIINPDDSNGGNISTIVLSGMTAGETIVANDMIDIGQLSTDPLRFLTFTFYRPSESAVQGRVITGGTVDGSGDLTITVAPAYIYDATNTNAYRNLSRAIVLGSDTLRIAKSHRIGLLYFGDYGFKINPELGDCDPYDTATVNNKDVGLSMRVFYGKAGIGSPFKYFVHEMFLGYGSASEGFARILYPLDN